MFRRRNLVGAGALAVAFVASMALVTNETTQLRNPPRGFDLRRPYEAELVETRQIDGKVTDRRRHVIHFESSEAYTVVTTRIEGAAWDRTEETRRPGSYRRVSPDAYYDLGEILSPDEQVRLSDEIGPDKAGGAVEELIRSGRLTKQAAVYEDETGLSATQRPVPLAAQVVLGLKPNPAPSDQSSAHLAYASSGDSTVGRAQDGDWSLTVQIDSEGRPTEATEVAGPKKVSYSFKAFTYLP